VKDLRSSTSELAIIEYWNQRQRGRFPERVGIDWVEHYFPENLFYLRRLTEKECTTFDSAKSHSWFGIFLHTEINPAAVAPEAQILQEIARKKNVRLLWVH
jgi:hypothetical protein